MLGLLMFWACLMAKEQTAEKASVAEGSKASASTLDSEKTSGANLAESEATVSGNTASHLLTQFPGFTIDFKEQEVLMDARICLDEGILEYLACTKGSFDHEAIFDTEAKPELLHASLLFLGMEPDPRYIQMGSVIWDLTGKRPNCLMKIYVQWEEAGQLVRVDLEHFLINREEGEEDEYFYEEEEDQNAYWVFTGSFFYKAGEKQVYAANENGGVVAVWMNPSCVIQYGRTLENPYQGEESGLEINTEVCPPVGTKVKLVFKPHTLPQPKRPKGKASGNTQAP